MEQRVFKPGLRRRWRSFTRNIPLPDCLEDNRIAIAIRPDLPDQFFWSGRARLSTKPSVTGSDPAPVNTMGIVLVAFLAARQSSKEFERLILLHPKSLRNSPRLFVPDATEKVRIISFIDQRDVIKKATRWRPFLILASWVDLQSTISAPILCRPGPGLSRSSQQACDPAHR